MTQEPSRGVSPRKSNDFLGKNVKVEKAASRIERGPQQRLGKDLGSLGCSRLLQSKKRTKFTLLSSSLFSNQLQKQWPRQRERRASRKQANSLVMMLLSRSRLGIGRRKGQKLDRQLEAQSATGANFWAFIGSGIVMPSRICQTEYLLSPSPFDFTYSVMANRCTKTN